MPISPDTPSPDASAPTATALLSERLQIEAHSSEPLYLQLQRQIEALVQSGDLPAGTGMPSERDLADTLKLSRTTVKRTYDGLRQARLLLSNGRRGGTAVHGAPRVSPVLSELKGFTAEMRELGRVPSTHVLERGVVTDAAVASTFGRPAGAEFLRLVRLRLADGTPMSREIAWYDLGLAPALAGWAGDGSSYGFIREHCGIELAWADQSVEAVTSSAVETAVFGFQAPGPCLLLKRLSCTATGQPVEYAEGTFRGDAYRYRVRLKT